MLTVISRQGLTCLVGLPCISEWEMRRAGCRPPRRLPAYCVACEVSSPSKRRCARDPRHSSKGASRTLPSREDATQGGNPRISMSFFELMVMKRETIQVVSKLRPSRACAITLRSE